MSTQAKPDAITGSLMEPAIQQCPYAHYQQLRDHAPVYFMEDMGMYIVTSYDLLMQVMKDYKTFSNLAPGGRRAGLYCEEAEKIVNEKGYGRFMPTIVNNDPPGHTIYRSLVNDAFRAGRIRKMEDYIEDVVDRLIGQFEDEQDVDAVTELAVPVPMYVIADQLGVPRSEFRRFKEWSDAWVAGLGLPVPDEVLIDAAEKVVEMQHYMIARMGERREQPEDDILSDLVQATYDDGKEERPLTDMEILSIVEQILVAGNETTTNGIANGILQLATDKALQDRLRAKPEETKAFVEEILRFESPVQGLFRYVTQDTELGGVKLPKGATVMIRYASGNRDETKFDHAEQFDMDRRNNGAHIAFGSGTHHCVGSQLARAEMLLSFRSMLRHFSNFALAVPEDTLEYHFSFALRGPKSLPLRLEKA